MDESMMQMQRQAFQGQPAMERQGHPQSEQKGSQRQQQQPQDSD
jgi:hypothetical protein